MSKFKVGDRVRVKKNGIIGTISRAEEWRTFPYKITNDPNDEPFESDELELFAPEPRREFIVIRRDGAKTIAELRHDREVIKSGTAICNASDTFDFDTGAKLAFDRLMGREEPKPSPAPEPPKFYTGKVVCYGCEAGTEWVYGALIGKIGTIQNGHATWRSGLGCEGYTSFDDFCARNKYGRWLEIKE